MILSGPEWWRQQLLRTRELDRPLDLSDEPEFGLVHVGGNNGDDDNGEDRSLLFDM